jgi:hypothetical protein
MCNEKASDGDGCECYGRSAEILKVTKEFFGDFRIGNLAKKC